MSSTPADARKTSKPSRFMRRITDATERQIDKIVAAASACPTDHLKLDTEAFIRRYFADVSAEDLRDRKPADLAGMALSHLTFGLNRQPGTTLVRAFNAQSEQDGWESKHTIIQIVNDDMPFIVDSVALVLNRQKLTIHVTIHPVIRVRRNDENELCGLADDEPDALSESFVQIEVDRETDTDVLSAVTDVIHESMLDVRAATTDWVAMRAKLVEIMYATNEQTLPLDRAVVDESVAMMKWMADDNFTFLGYREL